MDRVPIMKLGRALLVSLQAELHDRVTERLLEDLSEHIVRTGARGVMIDISGLEIVDSFTGRILDSIAGVARLLGASTVIVGMQPAVAITLVELGLSLPGVRTALTIERGMRLIGTVILDIDDDGAELEARDDVRAG